MTDSRMPSTWLAGLGMALAIAAIIAVSPLAVVVSCVVERVRGRNA